MSCVAGQFQASPGQPGCNECMPGMYADTQAVECDNCTAGRFQPHFGKAYCEQCADGQLCPVGSEAELVCPASFYCPPGAAEGVPCDSKVYAGLYFLRRG